LIRQQGHSHKEQIDSKIAECRDEISTMKDALVPLLEERGENWADEDGYARLVSAGRRISYDTRALDDLVIKEPLRYGWLKDYRKETEVAGRLQVK
jgi:hypothetical protein